MASALAVRQGSAVCSSVVGGIWENTCVVAGCARVLMFCLLPLSAPLLPCACSVAAAPVEVVASRLLSWPSNPCSCKPRSHSGVTGGQFVLLRQLDLVDGSDGLGAQPVVLHAVQWAWVGLSS